MTAVRRWLLVGVVALVCGCGGSPPASGPRPPRAHAQLNGSPPPRPLDRELTMTLPKGWKRASPSTLLNESIDARVDIMVGKSVKSLELELQQFCRMLTVQGWHCQNGIMADDGSEGTFPFDTPRRHGRVAVRHYPDGTALILKGEWAAERDKKASQDFAAIFLSIDPK